MAKPQLTTKRLAINKANAQTVVIVAVASFVTVFCLIAAKSLWGQTRYQARVTTEKEKAHHQLEKNLAAFDDLVVSYKKFEANSTNIINGSRSGKGDSDGSNSKIILDALPSSYDFPALASSLEKILNDQSSKAGSFSGTDDQLTQQNNNSSTNPEPVSMPFSFEVSNGNYSSVKQLITTLEKSIRPIQIDGLELSGGSSSMSVSIRAHTYYQPGKSVSITQKVVK